MSMTDPGRGTGTTTTARSGTEVRGATRDSMRSSRSRMSLRETKPSFLTTEFWAMVAGIAALVVLYNLTDNPDLTLWRTSLLCTVIASAYIVSRGWAKSGSHADHVERYDPQERGYEART